MEKNIDPRIDDYLEALPSWQKDVLVKVRGIVHEANPLVVETIKRSKLPYFTLNGNICAFMAAKDHVNIFIYDPIAPDPEEIINQGKDNATARAIQIYQNDSINEKALLRLFQEIIANNLAGGWRKLKDNK